MSKAVWFGLSLASAITGAVACAESTTQDVGNGQGEGGVGQGGWSGITAGTGGTRPSGGSGGGAFAGEGGSNPTGGAGGSAETGAGGNDDPVISSIHGTCNSVDL